MKSYIPVDKRTKRAQREYNRQNRLTWGALNPVTRCHSEVGYNRAKEKAKAQLLSL